MSSDTLCSRLGGHEAIAAVSEGLLTRLKTDAQLGRFWQKRGDDVCAAKSSCSSSSCAQQPASVHAPPAGSNMPPSFPAPRPNPVRP